MKTTKTKQNDDDDNSPGADRAKKKFKGPAQGSAADYKRKEANRLAADRSRSRQAEKITALNQAAQSVVDENIRLKEEVARLELELGQQADTDPDADPISIPNPNGDGDGDSIDNHETDAVAEADADADAEAHSRTILAVLMESEALRHHLEDQWMHSDVNEGVNVQQGGQAPDGADVEDSGIAGIASAEANDIAGEGPHQGPEADIDGGDNGDLPILDQLVEDGQSREQVQVPQQPLLEDVKHVHAHQPLGAEHGDLPPLAVSATDHAISINIELARLIQDDLALTKASIARVEDEIAVLTGRPRRRRPPTHGQTSVDVSADQIPSCLPEEVFLTDPEELRAASEKYEAEIDKAESELPVLREMVTRMIDLKGQEEAELRAMVDSERVNLGGSDVDEKGAGGSALTAIQSYISDRLKGAGLGDGHSTLIPGLGDASFSSPAIARRRRGRPAKAGDRGLAFLLPTRRPRPARPSQSNKARGLVSAMAPQAAASASVTASEAEVEGAHGEQLDIHIDSPSSAPPSAEELILSHLARHGVGTHPHDAEESGAAHEEVTLEHLAHLLPQVQGEAEAAAGEGEGAGVGTDAGSNTGDMSRMIFADPDQGNSSSHGNDDSAGNPEAYPRFKQGPPGSCDICSRTETTVWRRMILASGEMIRVCNACGLYHKKFAVARPKDLWGDGKSLKKRRKTATPRSSGIMPDSEAGAGEDDGDPHEEDQDQDQDQGTFWLAENEGQDMVDPAEEEMGDIDIGSQVVGSVADVFDMGQV